MKTSGEILLEEVKSQYARQLEAWNELSQKFNTLLQLDGLLLTVIFIGIGLQHSYMAPFVMLILSSSLIVLSAMIGIYMARFFP